jgi:curved DNA-binding protein CbpA
MTGHDDPFDLLGVPAIFDLTSAQLRAAFLARSAEVHPDSALDDPEAEGRSAALNHAKRVLDDPEARAEALLARLGGARKEQDRALPPSFLQEMMETREEIERAFAVRDPGQMERWEAWAAERRAEHIAAVKRFFAASGEEPGARAGVLRQIRLELNMWRYVERLIEQLHAEPDAPRP